MDGCSSKPPEPFRPLLSLSSGGFLFTFTVLYCIISINVMGELDD